MIHLVFNPGYLRWLLSSGVLPARDMADLQPFLCARCHTYPYPDGAKLCLGCAPNG